MVRTTVMADQGLLDRLREIARREGLSLGEVIRQGMEMRAAAGRKGLGFIGVAESADPPYDTGARSGDIGYQPRSWR
jgi:hypothetical protein